MNEPEIRYVRTPDGATLAYYEIGAGVPAVWMDMPYSHLQVEWRQDEGGGAYRTVASQARLIRFDHRGFGLSDRDPPNYTLDGFVCDLETIVDRLELSTFILLATRGPTTPIALTYAARHPERITDMILFNAALGIPAGVLQRMKDMVRLGEGDWRFGSEGISRLVLGWDDEAASKAHAELLRASVEQEGFCRWIEEYSSWNIRHLLPDVRTRTLLTNTRGDAWFGEDAGRALAAEMPDARSFIGDAPTAAARMVETSLAVASFLGRVGEPPPRAISASGTAPDLALTERETEVLRLLAGGLSNRAMADRLVVSVRTVETHVAHIYAKLGVINRTQATAAAINRGLV